MNKNIFLIIYDIADNRTRTRLSKMLIKEGFERIQLSVFTGLYDPRTIPSFWSKINLMMNKSGSDQDKLLVIKQDKEMFRNLIQIGKFEADIEYLLGERKVLII